MKRIRIGNDFVYLWAIERMGMPEDLDGALDKRLLVKTLNTRNEVPFTTTGNVIRVELTPAICSVIGAYNLEFSYKLPDASLSDDERACAVDIDAFHIVGKSAQADEVDEITSTSDVALGLNGKDAFEVWLEDNPGRTREEYYDFIRRPAIDAAQNVAQLEITIQENEQTRQNQEEDRQRNTAEAISDAGQAAGNANNAAENANNLITNMVQAEDFNDKIFEEI